MFFQAIHHGAAKHIEAEYTGQQGKGGGKDLTLGRSPFFAGFFELFTGRLFSFGVFIYVFSQRSSPLFRHQPEKGVYLSLKLPKRDLQNMKENSNSHPQYN